MKRFSVDLIVFGFALGVAFGAFLSVHNELAEAEKELEALKSIDPGD